MGYKFRAWDKKTRQYRAVESIYLNQKGEVDMVVTVDPITHHDPWDQDISEVILEQYVEDEMRAPTRTLYDFSENLNKKGDNNGTN